MSEASQEAGQHRVEPGSVAGRLAAWCAGRGKVWSDLAVGRARDAVEDTIACMIAGAHEAPAVAARRAALAWGRGGATAVGTAGRLSAPAAALVNGTAAHSLDYDDIFVPSFGHASAVLVPALLALAEERGRDGPALLDAYIVGLEMQAAVGAGVNRAHYLAGWHSTSTIGCIGAAAGCARLIGLDAEGIAQAMVLAVSMAGGTKVQFGTAAKPLHAGLGAQHAVQAAVLAEAGMTGRPEALEGRFGFLELYGAGETRGWEGHLEGLGDTPAIETVGLNVKRHPCCGSAHNTLDCVLELQAEHGFAAAEVERVDTLVGSINVRNLMYATPRNEMEARFSMPYCVAAALHRGRLSLADFRPEAVRRPAIVAMIPRIHMTGRDPKDEPTEAGTRLPHEVRIRLADGRVLERARTWPRGGVQAPLDAEDRRIKFEDCVAPVLGADAAATLRTSLGRLDRLADLSEVTAALALAGTGAAAGAAE
ncbi:2-methylcitrate dehydratase [Thalassobaculum fulvum]|uniref:2-methylcitrate dehydratase n=1 Tax=Thalassobaculum fulvum TaxID=1633335 RepID=A0A918XU27_9PROT|nr:MmgE/PrpD family protein [Thalassobaculum fulvum]GHD56104.1 2-methylcitrate dehydratase [Thalassobaculum fulvum]